MHSPTKSASLSTRLLRLALEAPESCIRAHIAAAAAQASGFSNFDVAFDTTELAAIRAEVAAEIVARPGSLPPYLLDHLDNAVARARPVTRSALPPQTSDAPALHQAPQAPRA